MYLRAVYDVESEGKQMEGITESSEEAAGTTQGQLLLLHVSSWVGKPSNGDGEVRRRP